MTPKAKEAFKIFERDDFTCQFCGRKFPPEQPPLHRHRRVFGSQGGTYDPENVATACNDCHNSDNHANLKGEKLYLEENYSVIDFLTLKFKGENACHHLS